MNTWSQEKYIQTWNFASTAHNGQEVPGSGYPYINHLGLVKLSDRITNLQPPPEHWDRKKIDRYRAEAVCIADELGGANNYLAERLRSKISDYA